MIDLTSLERLSLENQRLQELLIRDSLTGVSSRRSTELQISEALPRGGALLMCDLDNFKQINDRLGHLEGDVCLRMTGEVLREQARTGDIVGRVGGDEFVLFFPEVTDPEIAYGFKNRIQYAIRSKGIESGKPLAISIGIAISRPEDSYETLFSRADQALMAEKRQKPDLVRSVDEGDVLCQSSLLTICRDLTRKPTAESRACRVDYESFRVICRFLARRMQRCSCRAWILLFSLKNELSAEQVQALMPQLDTALVQNLRSEDVCTQYSQRQLLVLLPSTNSDGAATAAKRLLREINQRIAPLHTDEVLNIARMPLG